MCDISLPSLDKLVRTNPLGCLLFGVPAFPLTHPGITLKVGRCVMPISNLFTSQVAQLATYDQSKEAIIASGAMKDGFGTHVTASFAAGFVAAIMSNPLDVIKTRLMSMKLVEGKAPYRSGLDCAMKTVQSEGIMALYKVTCADPLSHIPYSIFHIPYSK